MVIEWGIVLLKLCTYVYHGLTRKEGVLMGDESLCLLVAVIHETLGGIDIIIGKVGVLSFEMQGGKQVLELVDTQVGLKKTDEAERVELWGLFPRPPEGESRFYNGITIPIYIRAQDVDIKIGIVGKEDGILGKLRET